jgi:hypothetical protein
LDVPRICKYSYQSLTDAIFVKAEEIEKSVEQTIAKHELDDSPRSSDLIDAFMKNMLDSKKRDRNPYFYLKLIQHFKPTTPLKLAEKGLRKLFPDLTVLEKFLEYQRQHH